MIILWILLGIIGFILFLLCLPMTIKISWNYPPEERAVTQHRSYLTDEVRENIDEMELCEEDKELLYRLVGELPPIELPPQKELLVNLRLFLLFNIKIFPMKEQPAKKRSKPMEQKPKKKTEEKQEPKPNKQGVDIKELIPRLWEAAKKPLRMIVGDICLHRLRLNIVTAQSDSAQTALSRQKILTAVYTSLAAAQNLIRIKDAKINVQPDFYRGQDGDMTLSFGVSIHPIVILAAGARFSMGLVKILTRKDKQIPPQTVEKSDGTQQATL